MALLYGYVGLEAYCSLMMTLSHSHLSLWSSLSSSSHSSGPCVCSDLLLCLFPFINEPFSSFSVLLVSQSPQLHIRLKTPRRGRLRHPPQSARICTSLGHMVHRVRVCIKMSLIYRVHPIFVWQSLPELKLVLRLPHPPLHTTQHIYKIS